jgi:hypothetical protein
MKKTILAALVAVTMIALLAPAASAENYSVSPPPLAFPSWNAGETQGKFGLTYISMEGDGFEMTGGGVNFVTRQPTDDFMALSFNVGGNVLAGEAGTSDLTFAMINFGLNLEFQPIHEPTFSTILFIGPAFNYMSGNIDPPVGSATFIDIWLYGVQAGMQLGLNAGSVQFAPFFMMQSMQGTMNVDTGGYTYSADVEGSTSTSYGLDIVHTPSGVTLSSLVQKATEDNSGDTDTTVITLSWRTDM